MATKSATKSKRTQQRKSSRSPPSTRGRQSSETAVNALELLEQDHRQVEEWFDEYDELSDDEPRKAELAEKLCLALKVHTKIEEEIFYPQAREATKDKDLLDEAVV